MISRDSIPRQQLQIIKEDLHLKRKLIEQAESVDKEFLQHAQKMAKTMDTLTGAMTGCFQMMQSMFELQMQQSRQSMQQCYQDPREEDIIMVTAITSPLTMRLLKAIVITMMNLTKIFTNFKEQKETLQVFLLFSTGKTAFDSRYI